MIKRQESRERLPEAGEESLKNDARPCKTTGQGSVGDLSGKPVHIALGKHLRTS